MIKVEVLEVAGLKPAIHGMRNPLNSWAKSDSHEEDGEFVIGEADLDLAKRLTKAGTEHRKFDRMMMVYLNIEANHTFWAELDTYKVGTVRNSCSKMHKIHVKEFDLDQFDTEAIEDANVINAFESYINVLEHLRTCYNKTKEKKYWRAIIDMLPMGYRLKATYAMSYETALNIIKQRQNHKMKEWNDFVDVLLNLPYMRELAAAAEIVEGVK